jgi:hypothetical protein
MRRLALGFLLALAAFIIAILAKIFRTGTLAALW